MVPPARAGAYRCGEAWSILVGHTSGRPLRALPYAGDDLDVTLRVLRELARADGVGLHLPAVWRREDPSPLLR